MPGEPYLSRIFNYPVSGLGKVVAQSRQEQYRLVFPIWHQISLQVGADFFAVASQLLGKQTTDDISPLIVVMHIILAQELQNPLHRIDRV